MKNYLLSMYPLRATDGYARVYVTPICGTARPFPALFVSTREDLAIVLQHTTLKNTVRHILASLDRDDPVQIAVGDEDALLIASTVNERTQ